LGFISVLLDLVSRNLLGPWPPASR